MTTTTPARTWKTPHDAAEMARRNGADAIYLSREFGASEGWAPWYPFAAQDEGMMRRLLASEIVPVSDIVPPADATQTPDVIDAQHDPDNRAWKWLADADGVLSRRIPEDIDPALSRDIRDAQAKARQAVRAVLDRFLMI